MVVKMVLGALKLNHDSPFCFPMVLLILCANVQPDSPSLEGL